MLDLSTAARCAQDDSGSAWQTQFGIASDRVLSGDVARPPSTGGSAWRRPSGALHERRHGCAQWIGARSAQSAGSANGPNLAPLVAILGDDAGDRRARQLGIAGGEGRDDPLMLLFQSRAALVLVMIQGRDE